MELHTKISYLSIFSAAAISIFVVESLFPISIPGVRLGLSNIFILLALIHFGLSGGLIIGIFKVIIGSLIVGKLLTPSFIFSLSGTMVSIAIMYPAIKYIKQLSILGISVLGAEFHVITQLVIATYLFFPESSFIYLSPIYIISALVTGSIIGIITYLIHIKIKGQIEIA